MLIEMFILVIIFALMGTALGTFTGITPGIHVNNVAIMLLTIAPAIVAAFAFMAAFGISSDNIVVLICVCIFAATIAHTFLDFIPSTFLGAPEPDKALTVLPAHKMLIDGDGYKAVALSSIGSFGAIVAAVILIVPYRIFIGNPLYYYEYMKDFMAYIILGVAFIILLSETNAVPYIRRTDRTGRVSWTTGTFSRAFGVAEAAMVFVISGLFGIVIFKLNVSSPFGLPPSVLFPALSGTFGIAGLIESFQQNPYIPPQRVKWPHIDKAATAGSIFSGTVAGSAVGFLPGLSTGVATVMTMMTRKDPKPDQVIITLSSIGAANSYFVMIALYLILRPRSGAAIVIDRMIQVQEWNGILMPQTLAYFLIGGVLAACVAFMLTLFFGARCAGFFHRMPYRKVVAGIIVFVTVMVFMFTGWLGLLVLAAATAIGLIAPALGVRRSHAMGMLMLPVILMLWPM